MGVRKIDLLVRKCDATSVATWPFRCLDVVIASIVKIEVLSWDECVRFARGREGPSAEIQTKIAYARVGIVFTKIAPVLPHILG